MAEARSGHRLKPAARTAVGPPKADAHPEWSFQSKLKWSTLASIRMPNKGPDRTQFLRGTLDLMILQSLATIGPMHGYAIAARLEQRGLIRGAWDTTENNRQARFYSITAAGRRQLATEKKSWHQMVAIMQTLFGTPT